MYWKTVVWVIYRENSAMSDWLDRNLSMFVLGKPAKMISVVLRKHPFITEKFVYTDAMYLQPVFSNRWLFKILHKSVKNERKWTSEAQPASPTPKFRLIPEDNCNEITIHGVILKEAIGLWQRLMDGPQDWFSQKHCLVWSQSRWTLT